MVNSTLGVEPLVSVRKLAIMLDERPEKLRDLGRQASKYYKPFDKLKLGSKKVRHIDNPTGSLKAMQSKINKKLLGPVHAMLPDGVVGGVRLKSNITNAASHTNQEMVLTLDIKKCYPETGNYAVKKALQRELGSGNDVAELLMKLTTYNGHLPQGAPTSPILCNLVLLPLFRDISALIRPQGLTLTMYVDDITVSGNAELVRSVTGKVIGIIQKYGYRISNKKTKLMGAGGAQIVTGAVVNVGIGVQRKTIEAIRAEILALARRPAAEMANEAPRILGKLRYYAKFSKRAKRALDMYLKVKENNARIQK